MKKCPKCQTWNEDANTVCKSCQNVLPAGKENGGALPPTPDKGGSSVTAQPKAASSMPPLPSVSKKGGTSAVQPPAAPEKNASPSSHPPKLQEPLPSGKGGKKAAAVVIALGCGVALLFGGWTLWNSVNSNSHEETEYPVLANTLQETAEQAYYRAPVTIDYYSSLADETPIGYFQAGERLFIEGIAESGTETWGKTSENQWVCLSDKQYTYAFKEEELEFKETDVNKNFASNHSGYVDCYAVPVITSKPTGDLDVIQGGTYYIQTQVADDSGNIFGKLDKNKWILLSQTGKTNFTAVSNTESEKTDTAKKDSTVSVPSSKAAAYTAGQYKANYDMKIRSGASLSASQIGSLKKNSTVYLAYFKASDNSSVWGEADYYGSGKWICVEDSEYQYLSKTSSSVSSVVRDGSGQTGSKQTESKQTESKQTEPNTASDTIKPSYTAKKEELQLDVKTAPGDPQGIDLQRASGPFVVWSVLEYMSDSHEISDTLATVDGCTSALGTTDEIGTPADTIRDLLNKEIPELASPYKKAAYHASEWKSTDANTITGDILKSLDQGKPVIAMVNQKALFGNGYNTYFITISGYTFKTADELCFTVNDAYQKESETREVKAADLMEAMRTIPDICYIY